MSAIISHVLIISWTLFSCSSNSYIEYKQALKKSLQYQINTEDKSGLGKLQFVVYIITTICIKGQVQLYFNNMG